MAKPEPFQIGGTTVRPGSSAVVDLPVSVMSDHTPASLSVQVLHGAKPGPVLFVSAAVHGDEIVGVEIIRRLLRRVRPGRLRGTLLAVPIVNTFGFLTHSRYLPDRRDLNRSFPGSPRGSLAARLAHLFMTEIVARADLGIDLHSAAQHRTNLPQIRISPGSDRLRDLARQFGAPVILTSSLRDGSLRGAARDAGVDMLLYEAGEGLRFDEFAVRAGVTGILRVMHGIGMLAGRGLAPPRHAPVEVSSSSWVRAPAGGLLRTYRAEGETVEQGDLLGVVSDPFGETEAEVRSPGHGVIVGRAVLPVVNEGDALFHVAEVKKPDGLDARIEGIAEELSEHPLFDEDEII